MIIHYQYDLRKTIEVILYLLKKRNKIGRLHIQKTLYLADKYHLNKYYRPIIGDEYVAVTYGPMASVTENLLLKDDYTVAELGEEIPFEKEGIYCTTPKRVPNMKKLSQSDIEEIDIAWDYVKDKSFDELNASKEIHDEAYHKVWDSRTTNNPLMNYYDMLSEENKKKAEEIFECTENMVL